MKKIVALLIFITLNSCALISPEKALKRTGIFETSSELKIIENEKQKIIFIGMHHLGKKEFYKDVAKKIDSLQELNYSVFYELVTNQKQTDSLSTVRNIMKLRKLIGFLPDKHLDTTDNKISGGFKYKKKYNLINQPKYSMLNVDTLTALKADVSLIKLITEYEKKEGEIRLDSCDLLTKISNRNYKCKKVKKKILRNFKMKYLGDYREKYLAKKIYKSNKDKVLVIYGDSHFIGLYFKLAALDKNYRLKKI